MKGMPHTVKVERRGNELIVHLALLEGPHPKLPGGVLLHSEGWVDIGYGLKMFLVVATVNTTIRSFKTITEEKRSFAQRLFGRKSPPLLEDKS
ncbi:hypothetical protein AUG19_06700 [archaeon 13_1_20CM_2_54_9]|nr:MAG: hypothetical protein AUJ07_09500 [Crenarchaeota archaeon 13_1_40CM_3_53_5]OLE75090.1 MAG: hypothetical protein AUG19_06700 [archaeon 13_1_20CM_2_54_9]TMI27298.1 MAG: hypothetical protein E6H36_03015 [Candidatus Bathyarchaeota archaeon]TMI31851.1 MAG: hypothetical protein E6H29_03845 [Candidatus Bathyarchaeota archaeon]